MAGARATQAAIARGWVLDEAPEPLHRGLLALVAGWEQVQTAPLGALWHGILDVLDKAGCRDVERAACEQALALMPDQPSFRLCLGRCLIRVGREDDARRVLADVGGLPVLRAEAALLMGVLDEAEACAMELSSWSGVHTDLVRHFLGGDRRDRAEAFLVGWTGRWGVPRDQVMGVASAALAAGLADQARPLFDALWRGASDRQTAMLGRFNGWVAPYGPEVEARLMARIDAAFALEEAGLNRYELPDDGDASLGSRVLMVTFGDRALANDLAVHYAESARAAGVAFHLYADTALILPDEFIGSDVEVAERLDRFEVEMERLRPDVVIVDVVSPLKLRGLDPGRMFDLKQRLGFHLLGLMRDSHRYAMPLVHAWAPACDALQADVLSPAWDSSYGTRLFPLLVPVFHPAFMVTPRPEPGLVFIGAVNFVARNALLAVLLTEDIPFTAHFGPARRKVAPDMASYAGVLSRAGGVLNISAHTPDDHLVTGRVWETMAAGSLLVEQDNPGTSRYFTPYRHYLPWSGVEEICHIATFIARHPEVAARIAAEGRAWALRHYDSRRFWKALLGMATRPRPDADPDAERIAAHSWPKLTIG